MKSKKQLPEMSFLLLLSAFLAADLFLAHPWGVLVALLALFFAGVKIGYRS